MANKKLIALLFCFLCSIMVVMSLWFFNTHGVSGSNGFTRLFQPQQLGAKWEMNLPYNSYYLAGTTAHHIFLGNATAPQTVLQFNWNLLDSQSFLLQVPGKNGKIPASLDLMIDSPWVYLIGRESKSIIEGNWKQPLQWLDMQRFPYFNLITPIVPSIYVIQAFDDTLQQRVLIRVNSNGQFKERYVLDKYKEGIFSPDGLLHYDTALRQFIYVYYYRNKFIFLDSNLNLLAKHHTIDTIFTPQLKILNIPSEKTMALEGIPVKPNVNSSIDGGNLYIQAGLKAENESLSSFQSQTVIDVYDLQDGHYRFSFYVPRFHGEKLKDCKVRNHKFLAFYGSHLVIYQLRL